MKKALSAVGPNNARLFHKFVKNCAPSLVKVPQSVSEYWKVRHALGRLFCQHNMYDIGSKMLLTLIEDMPIEKKNLSLFYDAGRILEDQGCLSKARELYDQILSIDIAYKDVAARREHIAQLDSKS